MHRDPRASLRRLFGLAALTLSAVPLSAAAASPIAISQVYGGNGSTYESDYVELFNRSGTAQSVAGWSIQYASATGTGNFAVAATLTGSIPAGGYYLVKLATTTGSGTVLPASDASGGTNISGTAGKVIVANAATALACNGGSTACSSTDLAKIVDLVGYGGANFFEGSGAAPAPSSTTAIFRKGNGCTDTDVNSADFQTGAPAPRNSATALSPCNASTNPGGTGAANPSSAGPGDAVLLTIATTQGANPSSPIASVTADLSAIGGSASQAFYDDGSHGDAVAGDGTWSYSTTVGAATSLGSKTLSATITDGIPRTGTATISLTVISPPESHTIMEIQGHGARSSFAGAGTTLGTTYVVTPSTGHQNIVTAVGAKGFFIQDTLGDGDPTTSDGIYVYTGSAPNVFVGDLVSVTGRIQEFSGSTEIAGGPSVSVVGHDDTLVPAPYDLTANLPSTDPSTGLCTGAGSTVVVPSADGQTRNDGYQAANFACLDGMLVTMSHGIVNAPTYTAANSGTIPSPSTPNNGFYAVAGGTRSFRKPGILGSDANRTATIPTFWGNPELIQIYYPGLGVSASSFPAAPNMPTGGIYNGGQEISLTGVMQGFQSATMPDPTYEIYPRSGSDLVLIGAPSYPAAVADPVAGKLTIGTQNMLHFFNNTADGADTSQYNDTCTGTGADDTCPTAAQYATRLKKMSLQIRTVLKAPVVQVVQEAENYSVLTDIANQIHGDDATITYHPYLIPGNDPGGINIGILVRDGVTVNSVTQIYGNSTTSACSSGSSCLLNDRPPVLLDAVYQGYHFRVLAIYDRSLSNLGVAGKDYVGRKRREQAEQVASIVQALQSNGGSVSGNAQQSSGGTVTNGTFPLAGDATVPVIILGDFNAYEFSDGYVDVTGTIMGTVDADPTHSVYPPTASYVRPNPVLFDTGSTVAQAQHYSYNFSGLLQEIDHILLTSAGQGDFVSVQSGRGNSDISVASLTLTQDTTPMRTSDHDGQVVTLGYVVTPSAGTGGTISPSTVQTVSSTKPVVFAVAPNSGNSATVTDTCGSAGGSAGSYDSGTGNYTIPAGVNKDCQVTATFAPTSSSYTVTTTVNGTGGTISAPAQSPVTQGGSTTFTVVPLSGYAIASVLGDTCSPSVQSGDTWTTGPITANCTITATFAATPINGACGSANGSAFTSLSSSDPNLCSAGTVSAFTGSGPWSWACSGLNGGTASGTCSANKAYTVTAVAGANGSISPASQPVTSGSTASFTVSPALGYNPTVTGDTCTVTRSSGDTWVSSTIAQDCHVTASFVLDYVPLSPARLLDTRVGAFTTVDGQYQGIGPLGSRQTLTLKITGRGGVPNQPISAVALNLVAVDPTAGGNIKVWSGEGGVPTPGNLNLNPGKTLPILVVAKVDSNGFVSIYNDSDNANTLTATVEGYFPVGSSYVPLVPERLMDTRGGPTVDSINYPPLGGQSQFDMLATGRGSLPSSGVGAIVMSVTAIDPLNTGFISIWPTGDAMPGLGNLNLNPGNTMANAAFAKVGLGGHVSFYNSGANPVNLTANLQGWFPTTSAYTPIAPQRFLDTRPTGSTIDSTYLGAGPMQPGQTRDLQLTGRGALPASGVSAVVLNLVSVDATGNGNLTMWPTGETRPVIGSVNLNPGMTVPNVVIAKVGANGKVSIYYDASMAGQTDVVVNVQGWFAGQP